MRKPGTHSKKHLPKFHRLDPIVRARAQPDELGDWEQLIALVEEKEEMCREIERIESQESQC